MSEEMEIEGKSYISSKRAAEISRYAQDYIGQLSRKGLIDARRIGGLWYVSMESLDAYKTKAEAYKPVPPGKPMAPEPGTLIFFDGKEYLSAARAAELTGYTQDYVGQLARAGGIESRQVGNRWYVERGSIVSHKQEKDALLANVQREAVGLETKENKKDSSPEYLANNSYFGQEPLLNYYSDDKDLMPDMMPTTDKNPELVNTEDADVVALLTPKPVSIHRLEIRRHKPTQVPVARKSTVTTASMAPRSSMPLLLGAAATIVIVLSVGYTSVLRQHSVYATNTVPSSGNTTALEASVYDAFSTIGTTLEPLLTHELIYQRDQ